MGLCGSDLYRFVRWKGSPEARELRWRGSLKVKTDMEGQP